MDETEENQLVVNAGTGGVVLGQLDELAMGGGSDVPVIIDTIGKTLAIIEENFYLVPKSELDESGDVIERAPIAGALELSLSEIWWNDVNS